MTRLDAYLYGAGIIGCTLVMTVLHHPLFFKAMRFGMQLRVASGCLVYRKVRLTKRFVNYNAQIAQRCFNGLKFFYFIYLLGYPAC